MDFNIRALMNYLDAAQPLPKVSPPANSEDFSVRADQTEIGSFPFHGGCLLPLLTGPVVVFRRVVGDAFLIATGAEDRTRSCLSDL